MAKQQFIKAVQAAVLLQTKARTVAAVNRLRKAVSVVTMLQAMLRGFLSAKAFRASVAACVVLQSSFRCRRAAQAFAADAASIVRVQSLARSRVAVRSLRASRHASTVVAVAWWRHAACRRCMRRCANARWWCRRGRGRRPSLLRSSRCV